MPCAVILNEVKNLLEADKRQPALTAHSQRGDSSLRSERQHTASLPETSINTINTHPTPCYCVTVLLCYYVNKFRGARGSARSSTTQSIIIVVQVGRYHKKAAPINTLIRHNNYILFARRSSDRIDGCGCASYYVLCYIV